LRASIGISIAVIEHSGGLQRAISVRKVKDADQSPLESGDILLQINGRELKRRIDVIRALGREAVDQQVTILIERNGESKTVEVLAKARTS
jgi:S1-C subfamily serine protease